MEKTTYAKFFSESLEVVTGESGLYCCPLSLGRAPVEDADSLTWDHYPTKSIGGRDRHVVLVCQGCQTRWTRTDAELDLLRKRDEFDKSYPGMKPVILSIPEEPEVPGLRHRAAFSAKEGSWQLFGRPEHNKEEVTRRLSEFLAKVTAEKRWDGLKVNIASDPGLTYSRRLVGSALLKAAYLAAFDWLGYPYILSSDLDEIRERLEEPGSASPSGFPLVFFPHQPGSDRKVLVTRLHTPAALTSLAVFFLGYELNRSCVVFLPLPSRPGFPKLDNLDQTLQESGGLGFVMLGRSRKQIADPEVWIVDEQGKEWPIYDAEDETDEALATS